MKRVFPFAVVAVLVSGCVADVSTPDPDSGKAPTALSGNGAACVLSSECASGCCHRGSLTCGAEVDPNADPTVMQACTCDAMDPVKAKSECESHPLLWQESRQVPSDPCTIACTKPVSGVAFCFCGRG